MTDNHNAHLIKHRYALTNRQCEDTLSVTYNGIDTTTNQSVLIWIVKQDGISPDTLNTLIQACERCLKIQSQSLTLKDYDYDGVHLAAVYTVPNGVQTLDSYITTHSPSAKDTWECLKQVLASLQVLEHHGLSAGQLNWHTVFIDPQHTVYLTQYYLSGLILKETLRELDHLENAVFCAPEVIHLRRFSTQTDLYAFGILAYKTLIHHWPFKPHTDIQKLKKEFITDHSFQLLHDSTIPPKIKKVILFCLQMDPSHRVKSVENLISLYKSDAEEMPKTTEKGALQHDIQAEITQSQHQERKTTIKRTIAFACCGLLVILFHQIYIRYITQIPEIRVPVITSMSLDDAQKIVQNEQLSLTVVGKRAHPTIPEGYIIETKPMAGRLVKQHRQIRVILSTGVKQFKVPELIGRNLEQAKMILGDYANNIVVDHQDYSVDFLPGIIMDQLPTKNNMISSTENIQVVLSQGYPVTTNITQAKSSFFINRDHQCQVDISFFLKDNWNPQTITIQYTLLNSVKKLYNAQHQPGDYINLQFNLDPNGILEVFFNDDSAFKQKIELPTDTHTPTPNSDLNAEDIPTSNETDHDPTSAE